MLCFYLNILGQQLISVRGACPKEVVQPKCDELTRVCDIVNERLSRRLEILLKSRDLMERIEKANKWCTRGKLFQAFFCSFFFSLIFMRNVELFLSTKECIVYNRALKRA